MKLLSKVRRLRRLGYCGAALLGLLLLITLPGCSGAPGAVSADDADAALERIAGAALGEHEEGAVLIIDPQTGRLRAAVNRRLAFEQSFPAGSAVKPFTAFAALRAGALDATARVECRTHYARGDFAITCSHPSLKAGLDLTQALAYSCNYYFAQLGERLGEAAWINALATFGFGARTGVNAGGENPGQLLRGGEGWGARTSLGENETLLATPVQMLVAYTALVNGGHLYRPQLLPAGEFNQQERARLSVPTPVRQALVGGLRDAVAKGTAAPAGFADLPLRVIGKTGTSTDSNNFRTQGWFIGFASDRRRNMAPSAQELGVLVFLRRAHGADSAAVARQVFEAYAQLRGPAPLSVAPMPEEREVAPLPAGQVIRVRSVGEKKDFALPLEEYVAGVVRAEGGAEVEFEALKAQAVISRTFALKNLRRHDKDHYDLCSTTHCQIFKSTAAPGEAEKRRAVAETAGLIVADEHGQVIDAYFHAACGGATANIKTLWNVDSAPAYLSGVRDDFCAAMPHRHWRETITAQDLVKALQHDARADVGRTLKNVRVLKRDASERAVTVLLEGDQATRQISGWDFKMIVGRTLGWHLLKSSRFEVARVGSSFVFRGGGFGHGLGLCQEGAHVMARRGSSFAQILAYYFPGTVVGRAKQDENQALIKNLTTALPRTVGGGWRSPQGDQFTSRGQRPRTSKPVIPTLKGSNYCDPFRFGKYVTANRGRCPRLVNCTPPAYGARGQLENHVDSRAARATLFWSTPPRLTARADNRRRLKLASEHFRLSYYGETPRQDAERVLALLEASRVNILRRLQIAGLGHPNLPATNVTMYAATAGFVAATGQPGWVAAVTTNKEIHVQPAAVLRRRRLLETTLRHEYTHVVIAAIQRRPTPRWLAEGLAAHMAGEGPLLNAYLPKQIITHDELEERFNHAASQQEMRTLYAASYRAVRELIRARGESALWQSIVGHSAEY